MGHRRARRMNLFEATVSALSYSIVQERCRPSDPARDDPPNRVVSFVLEQHGRIAAYLHFPLAALTLAFDAWGLFLAGRPFHQQSHDRRWKQVEAWRSSKIGPCRDLVRFYESLVVFASYSMDRDVALRSSVGAGVAEAVE
jgi:hypothetical protein